MYIPKHFDEPRTEVLHELMRSRSLATLVTLSGAGIVANHIPLLLSDASAPLGTLCGHVSRANALWQDFDPKVEALAIFAGPDTYVTPSWYPTKNETGRAVPTWNYVVAHAYGTLRVIEDRAWLRAHVEELTRHKESPRKEPWKVSDAPEDYIERLLSGIVGLEMTLTRIEGKWKVSQNQPDINRDGVVRGLEEIGDDTSLAMAQLVKERGPK